MHRSYSDHDRRAVGMSNALYNSSHTLAMPLYDAHFGGFFVLRSQLDITKQGVVMQARIGIMRRNNTPQASPPVRWREAQTGGFLISGVGYAI